MTIQINEASPSTRRPLRVHIKLDGWKDLIRVLLLFILMEVIALSYQGTRWLILKMEMENHYRKNIITRLTTDSEDV